MKNLFLAIAVAVALAGTAMPVLAEELQTEDIFTSTPTPNIASESESIGEFNSGENQADDMYQNLLDSLEDVDFDFYGDDDSSDPELVDEFFVPEEVYIDDDDLELVMPLANYDTYYGAIGSSYLEYMRGYLPKLGFREHYVGARVSQYQYIFAFGEDLSFDGNLFVGRDVNVIIWWTNGNGSFSHEVQSSFNLSVGNYLVYTDLSDFYPSLADLSGFTLRQVLILAVIVSLICTMNNMYQVRKIRKLGMH